MDHRLLPIQAGSALAGVAKLVQAFIAWPSSHELMTSLATVRQKQLQALPKRTNSADTATMVLM